MTQAAEDVPWEIAEERAGRAWGVSAETAHAVGDATVLHDCIYGSRMGECPIAEHMRDIALASYADRQKYYLHEVHRLNRASLIHLVLWGPEPCPDQPEPGTFPG